MVERSEDPAPVDEAQALARAVPLRPLGAAPAAPTPAPHRSPVRGWLTPLRVIPLVLLVAAIIVTVVLLPGSSSGYRTAVVSRGTAVKTLDSVGTVTPVNQANLNFDVSGTVSTVDVSVGQRVTAGETLASLDATSLAAEVTSRQASLASSQATLASDEASQSGSQGSGSSAPQSSSSLAAANPVPTTTTTPAAQPSGPNPQIMQLQQQLTADQQTEDADAGQVTASLAQATSACGQLAATTTTNTTTTTTTTTTPAGSGSSAFGAAPTSSGPSGTPSGSGSGGPACTAALSQATSAQSAVTADITKVEKDERLLTAAVASSTSSSGSGSGSGGAGSGGAGSGGAASGHLSSTGSGGTPATSAPASNATGSSSSQGSGLGGSKTKTVTAQQIALDQANIDVAQANLTQSQQALDDVNLVSTISGTVASVSVTPGGSVSSGSSNSSPSIVVVGSGSEYDVSTDVDVSKIGQVSLGQSAVVTPDSTNSAVEGKVTGIGVTTASGSSSSYPVTIAVNSSALGQLSGSAADVSIVVKKSTGVTTVPSSAVLTVGSIHLVTVLDKDGTTKSVPVTLGTVGAVRTQITSGVATGDQVVLANYSEPVPSSSTNNTFGGRFGGGGAFTARLAVDAGLGG